MQRCHQSHANNLPTLSWGLLLNITHCIHTLALIYQNFSLGLEEKQQVRGYETHVAHVWKGLWEFGSWSFQLSHTISIVSSRDLFNWLILLNILYISTALEPVYFIFGILCTKKGWENKLDHWRQFSLLQRFLKWPSNTVWFVPRQHSTVSPQLN